jgi:hypothetical protein
MRVAMCHDLLRLSLCSRDLCAYNKEVPRSLEIKSLFSRLCAYNKERDRLPPTLTRFYNQGKNFVNSFERWRISGLPI